MQGINANLPLIHLEAKIHNGDLQSISQSRGIAETSEISNKNGITLAEAQQKALTNGRLFEAGISMMILDNPGKIGQVFDTFSTKLATALESIFTEDGLNSQRNVRHNGMDKTLHNVFKETVVGPLTSPTSDQIGRKTGGDAQGETWILDKLRTPLMTHNTESNADASYAQDQDFKDLLTKVKAVCGFGTTIWQLMNTTPADRKANEAVLKDVLKPLGEHVADDFGARFDEFKMATRTTQFDDATSRMRSERPPLINGISIPVKYESAQLHGLGFGNVAVKTDDPSQQESLDKVLGARITSSNTKVYDNINGALRLGAPIETPAGGTIPARPFMMSRDEIDNLPKAYGDLQLNSGADQKDFLAVLNAHEFEHGVGVNRWQPNGTFAVESNLRGLPSAGSQSGGTCDALLALNTLSDTRLYDQPDVVEPATLGIAAFMNFGGYHTFAETVSVGMAFANGDDEYNPSSGTSFLSSSTLERDVERHPELMKGIESGRLSLDTIKTDFFGTVTTDVQHEDLYSRVTNMAHQYTGAQAFDSLVAISSAHEATHTALSDAHPELKDMGKVSIQSTRIDINKLT